MNIYFLSAFKKALKEKKGWGLFSLIFHFKNIKFWWWISTKLNKRFGIYNNKYMEKEPAELNTVTKNVLWHYQHNALTLVIQSFDWKIQSTSMHRSFNNIYIFSFLISTHLAWDFVNQVTVLFSHTWHFYEHNNMKICISAMIS